jgi:hypothetical protein
MDYTKGSSAFSELAEAPLEIESESVKEPLQKPLTEESVVRFWIEDPNILFNTKYLFEFFPVEPMSFEQKLNAITRLVLIMTLASFFYTHSMRLLFIGTISIFFIFMLYKAQAPPSKKEGLSLNPVSMNPASELYPLDTSNVFSEPTTTNPLSNVLVTDYIYNPQRKPAPPAYNENVSRSIVEQAKEMVQKAHPDIPDISDKLFKDLGDNMMFEQSLRPFYSTASTTIPNDQQSFSEFCYGSMVSCKEGNKFACAKQNSRYNNY